MAQSFEAGKWSKKVWPRMEDEKHLLLIEKNTPVVVEVFGRILDKLGGAKVLGDVFVEQLNRTKPGTPAHKSLMTQLYELMKRYDDVSGSTDSTGLAALSDEELVAMHKKLMSKLAEEDVDAQ